MLRPNALGQPWYPDCPLVPWTLDVPAELLTEFTDYRYLSLWPEDVLALLPSPDGRFCRWCGNADLAPRRSTWCNEWCRLACIGNHHWSQAKWIMRNGSRACVECGEPFAESRTQSGYLWRTSAEIDHRVPCNRRHAVPGCWHHLSGLQALCHDCHRRKTTRDVRDMRALNRDGALQGALL